MSDEITPEEMQETPDPDYEAVDVPVKAPVFKKKIGAGVDRFGNRRGSQAATVNEVLTKEWFTADEVCAATGLNRSRVSFQLSWLRKHGYLEKDKKRFRLK